MLRLLCSRCLRRDSVTTAASRRLLSRLQSPPPPPRAASPTWGAPSPASSSSSDPGASALLYISAAGVFMLGVSFASVPLYRKFCQMTGTASNPLLARVESSERVRQMQPIADCKLTVTFTADTNSQLAWNFKPQQPRVHLVPGETVLIFYTAKNPTNQPVTGIATYTVNPYQASQYFNKIQCFCFEEQRLNPGEEVDMPVFFYIDPEFVKDPRLRDVRHITLSYCFFEAKEGLRLPMPGFATA